MDNRSQSNYSVSSTATTVVSCGDVSTLNACDKSPIYVYNHRDGTRLKTSQAELSALLEKDRQLRCSIKPIPRGAFFMDVYQYDLWLPEERIAYVRKPNYNTNLAGVRIPWSVYIRRLFSGKSKDLYILSSDHPQPSEKEVQQGVAEISHIPKDLPRPGLPARVGSG
ncbi:hypothetical protein K470DRAFT_262538 [Piedraia hortae CBS 480.64]|uniref:Uncharacterized protein n=1 Tax=Piedraia hortae CBS 480.64 TaxID=1314780 RepID=A0A6A7C6N3_9PEZI|nr:hypothetical protein K470DRAFT_262538 [Piedraia hortae CBS 480.64]